MVIKLDEMAFNRMDAIDKCISLGKLFINHFLKVVEEGRESNDFSHHCHEMQNWYDEVKGIKLKSNNKFISKTHLIDWFFTVGQSPEDFMSDDLVGMYEDLYLELLRGKRVKDIFEEFLV